MVDRELAAALARRFADKISSDADLPKLRHPELEQSLTFKSEAHQLTCICNITGSSYHASWDGTAEAAGRLVDEAAEDTVFLIDKTRHYPWLRSRT